MRFKELITEIRDQSVDKMWAGQYGLPSEKRIEGNQILLGTYDDYYQVWTRDLRMQGDTNHEYEIEVTTKEIPHPFITPDNIDDDAMQRKFDGPREYIVIRMDLRPYIMQGDGGQEVNGSKVHFIQKVPEGIGSDINMVDFYIWIMNTLGTAMISDHKQSKGGASIWKRLASDPRVNVFGYSPTTSEFSQVDDEGDADLWDTWQGSDQDIVDQANSARKSAWGTVNIDDAVWQVHKDWHDGVITKDEAKQKEEEMRAQEQEIRKAADEARQANTDTIQNMLFAVPSNRSMHS